MTRQAKGLPPEVQKQWEKWSDENPPSSFEDVTDEQLKASLIADLTIMSGMDVKEYTLYQKWCEIHEKYPLSDKVTLWGDKTLKNPDQGLFIEKIKSNIWIPENPDDYLDLEPYLEYTDNTVYLETGKSFDGSTNVVVPKRNGDLSEEWNALRTFTSTMKNNMNIGRNMFFIVRDRKTKKYLGVIDISSDFLDLTPRDKAIGWDRTRKTKKMINYTAIGSTIVPLQPLGYNYVGGKLLALLCLDDEVQRLWKRNYENVLVGITTTSLYGKTKVGGLSQYDGLDHWNPMGFSSGTVAFEPNKDVKELAWNWLKKHHTEKYFSWWEAKKENGLPFLRDHKNRSLHFIYSKLGIPKNMVQSAHQRGIYFSPLYTNSFDFLREEIQEKDLVKAFDTSTEALVSIWKAKYAKGRISMLKKKNAVSKEMLFYDDLIYLSWEETKERYLTQVGR